MRNFLIAAGFALAFATPAHAQNDAEPALGRIDAAAPASRAVTFTATGSYGDLLPTRLIDVTLDKDLDGDGKPDTGVLRVTCNGGDMLSGVFSAGGSATAGHGGRKPKLAQGSAGTPIAAGGSFKGRWNGGAAGTDRPVTINNGAICPAA